MSSECKYPGCSRERETGQAHSRRFCSPRCEVTYDHLKMDAKDARLDETEPEGYTDRDFRTKL